MSDGNKPAPGGSLFNFSLSDIFGAGKGIEKLAATVGGGAGRVADGIGVVADVKWLDKARADNEAYRVQVVGDAQTRVMEGRARAVAALQREGQHLESMSITEGGVSAQLAGVSPETRDLYERTLRRMTYENAMQQLNRETVVGLAAAELLGEEQVSDAPVDPDWAARYFRTVQDITREDAQLIFGKILAGELKQPGTFSVRTIDFLSTLTQQEGELFRRLCSFALWRNDHWQIIYFEPEVDNYNVPKLSFGELHHLQNIGLITHSTGMIKGYILDQDVETFVYGANYLEVEGRRNTVSSKPVIDLGVVRLTNVGLELASVCQATIDPCVAEYLIDTWGKRNHGVAVRPRVPKPADI